MCNLSIKHYHIYVCYEYMKVMLYHITYSIRYYLQFHVTAVGLGTYVGGPKRNWKRSLMGRSVVVHASAARCLLREPFRISLQTGSVK